MGNRNDVRARLLTSALEKVVTERASARLHRTPRHRAFTTLDDQLNSKSLAQLTHVLRDTCGSLLERVVVVGGDDVVTSFDQRNQERTAVGTSGNCGEHALAPRNEARSAQPLSDRHARASTSTGS
jgi:hypothetical protein